MDLWLAAQSYVRRLVGEDRKVKTGQMRVLLLDAATTQIISMASTQSQLLEHEVYLVDRIDNPNREKIRHLECLVFIRPTPDSIQHVLTELVNPKYGRYELFFSNIVKKSSLERLAEADDNEVVQKVQEIFADYLVINRDLFSFNLHLPETPIFADQMDAWSSPALERASEGLLAVLLSLKKKPVIRYDVNSSMAKKLASEITFHINQEQTLFDFHRADTAPILLILDRKNDPVTPLLTPWTYQAMVHELIGIHNGRVDLSVFGSDVPKDLKEIVLSQQSDPFFKKSMYLNFGDLGANIKDYVDQYQSKTKSNQDIKSIADMKKFVENYPEFRKLAGNVSKHVTVVSELSRQVEKNDLLEVGELEQSLACTDNHNSDLKSVQRILSIPTVSLMTKIRLIALYTLRYEKHPANATNSLLQQLLSTESAIDAVSHGSSQSGVMPNISREEATGLIAALIRKCGEQKRSEDLFGSDSFFSRAQSGFKGLKGVENVYTQHRPLLERTLGSLFKGRLREQTHPYFQPPPNGVTIPRGDKPQDIIVFFVGGITFDEARLISQINEASTLPGVRIVAGGTSIINSHEFMYELLSASKRWPPPAPTNASQRLAARVAT